METPISISSSLSACTGGALSPPEEAGGNANGAANAPTEGPRGSLALTAALRWIGLLLLGVAVIDFLVEGLDHLAPGYRPFLVPALGAMLGLSGWVAGHRWQDLYGARLFFGLATVLAPVQFTQLGAMIHTHVYGVEPGQSGWWQFDGLSGGVIVLHLIASLILFVPLAYTGLAILARPQAQRLTGLLFAGSALLLLPWRDAAVTAVCGGVLLFVLHGADSRHLRPALRWTGWEARAARVIPWSPWVLLLVRGLFYPVDAEGGFCLAALMGVFLLHQVRPAITQPSVRIGCEIVALATVVAAWFPWAAALGVHHGLDDTATSLVTQLPIAALLITLAPFLQIGKPARLVGAAVAGVTILGVTNAGITAWGVSVLAIVIGMILVTLGYHHREWPLLAIGVLAAGSGLFSHMKVLLTFYDVAPSVSLGALSVLLLLAASFVERRGRVLWAWFRTHFLSSPDFRPDPMPNDEISTIVRE